MKQKISLLLAVLMVLACFAGCANTETNAPAETPAEATTAAEVEQPAEDTEPANPTGKITVWFWSDISHYIEPYMASHPGTEIEQVVVDAGDYLSKIQMTLTSNGTLPDIVMGEILSRGQLYQMNIVDDLTQAPYNFDPASVDPSVLPTMMNSKGEVLGIDYVLCPSGLAYYRDLAEQYLGTGDPAELEAMFQDWDSFIEAGVKVKEESGGKMSMFTSLGDVYYIINGQSKEARVSDGAIHRDVVLDLFTKICKFRDAGVVGKVSQWTPAWYASFGSEESIFAPMPTYGISNFIAPNYPEGTANWGLMTPPEGGFLWGGTAWSITKTSQNKELAWDFLKWCVLNQEGCDITLSRSETPAAAGYMTEEKLTTEEPLFANQKVMETYISDILPTINSLNPTEYDFLDICTIELVLESLNADYSMTAEAAADMYIQEMQAQTDLTVD